MGLSPLLTSRSFAKGLAGRVGFILVLVVLAASTAEVPWPFPGGWTGLLVPPFSALAFGFPAVPLVAIPALTALFGAWWPGALIALFLCDLACYLCLASYGSTERRHEVAGLYWTSPLAVLLIYGCGTAAVFPLALLLGAFLCLERRRRAGAGLLYGLAVAAQPVLIALLPPLLLFAQGTHRLDQGAGRLLGTLALALLLGIALSIGDVSYRALIAHDFVGLAGPLLPVMGGGVALLPLLLLAIYYAAWRARLLDRELLWTCSTLAALALAGLGGPSASTALIALPFLASHAAYAERSGRALLALYSVVMFGAIWFTAGRGAGADPSAVFWPTLAAGTALLIGFQIYQRGYLRSPAWLAMRRPIAIGIAGDSGVGKDTLVAGVAGLFSRKLLAQISGDDYHVWDRNKPMWRALTHLNPKANDLDGFGRHIRDLADRRWIKARHYDHGTGRMTRPTKTDPGDIVIASGLHALWSPELNRLYDLRIFLDMDEELRRHLKIRRDVHERGHPLERVTTSIERRHQDAVSFVHPQKAVAHIVFRLEPRRPEAIEGSQAVGADSRPVPLRLIVEAVPGIVFNRLARTLVALCGVQAIEVPRPSGATRLIIEGDPAPEDIVASARRIAPAMCAMVRRAPEWQDGLRGIMQLIMLDQLEQVYRRRSVNA